MRYWLMLCALLLTVHGSAAAQEMPDAVMRRFLAAVDEGRWHDAARLVDPGLLLDERESLVASYRAPVRHFNPEPEFFMRMDSTMPRAVAEWMAARQRRNLADADDEILAHQFARVRDTTELKSLSSLELVARHLEAQDERYHFFRAMQRNPQCAGKLMDPPAPPGQRELIGTVVRADTVWAIHRRAQDVSPFHAPIVTRLALVGGEWKLLPERPILSAYPFGVASISCDVTDSLPPR